MKITEYYKNFAPSATKNALNSLIEHSKQSEKLSKQIFNNLLKLGFFNDKLNKKWHLLSCAALLHDIGTYIETDKKHNKTGAKIILQNKIAGLTDTENLIVANIIRYHRGKCPKEKHEIYFKLNEDNKKLVCLFAGILRIADALDFDHFSSCEKITLKDDNEILYIQTRPNTLRNSLFDEIFAKKKKLLEKTINRKIVIEE